MRKHTLTAMVLSGALALSLTGGAMAASAFTDLSGLKSWALEAVDYVTSTGLMKGTGSTTFQPNGYADRSTVATLIWRMAGEPIGNITGTFSDVPLNQWYSDAIDWAAEAGVVTGDAGRFRPFVIVTRQDLAVMLYRYAGSPAADVTVLSYYQDYGEVSGYAANAMAWAVSEGILSGDGSRLMPQNGTTRVQLAAILMRYLEEDARLDTGSAPGANAAPAGEDVPADSLPSGSDPAGDGGEQSDGSGTGGEQSGGQTAGAPEENGAQADAGQPDGAPAADDGQPDGAQDAAGPQPGVETLIRA